MDFVLTSDVLIEFGLNLAGYLVITLLIYILLNRRSQRRNSREIDRPVTESPAPGKTRTAINIDLMAPTVEEEFGPRASRLPRHPIMDVPEPESNKEFDAVDAPLPAPAPDRQSNRRAIYREARRLLANGESRHELLDRLPLTEDELELIVTTS